MPQIGNVLVEVPRTEMLRQQFLHSLVGEVMLRDVVADGEEEVRASVVEEEEEEESNLINLKRSI